MLISTGLAGSCQSYEKDWSRPSVTQTGWVTRVRKHDWNGDPLRPHVPNLHSFTVSMNDNFYPSVTWAVPVSESNVPLLTRIKRGPELHHLAGGFEYDHTGEDPLQTVKWRMKVDIAVDPSKSLGSRARLTGRVHQDQPKVLTHMVPIPPNALGKPNANDAQVLMWRPKRGPPLVVIPSK